MPSTICNYIRRKEVISFMYDDARRVVEPHLLGLDESGDLTLSAWQTDGPTPDGWRDFWVAKMKNIAPTGKTFKSARPGYNRNDTTIKTIICRLTAVRTRPTRRRNPRGRRR